MIILKCKKENSFLENLMGARSFLANNSKQGQNSHYLKVTDDLIKKIHNHEQEIKTPPDGVDYIGFRCDEKEHAVFIEICFEVKKERFNKDSKRGLQTIAKVKFKEDKAV